MAVSVVYCNAEMSSDGCYISNKEVCKLKLGEFMSPDLSRPIHLGT